MPWRGPDYPGEVPTLGRVLLEWFSDHLTVPSGPKAGEPLVLSDEQALLVLNWYALDPKTGQFLYRRGSVRKPKGWGKSPLVAAIALSEFCGPTVFDGWDAAGEPVGRPEATPWVQIAATSEDQTDNTYAALHEMVAAHDGRAADELGIDLGITRMFLKDRAGRLEPVTARSGSREGQPITFGCLDETHLWTPRNGGVKLAATLRRNAAKMNRRTLETTNAYRPGERSVAEATHKAADRGQKGLLYVADEAPWVDDLTDRKALLHGLTVAYGDSTAWVDLARLVEEVQDADTTEADARRFYLNQIVEAQDAFLPAKLWEAQEAGPNPPKPGSLVAVGFDGSRFHDATALIGVDVRTGRQWVVGLWEQPDGDDLWEVPRGEVHAAVDGLFRDYTVCRMLCDPPDWDSDIADWRARHGEAVEAFATRSAQRMSPALKAYRNALATGELTHDGNPRMSEHALNTRLRVEVPAGAEDDPDRHVWKVRKPSPSQKIDGLVASVLAWQARLKAVAAGVLEEKPADRRLWTF